MNKVVGVDVRPRISFRKVCLIDSRKVLIIPVRLEKFRRNRTIPCYDCNYSEVCLIERGGKINPKFTVVKDACNYLINTIDMKWFWILEDWNGRCDED